jgi:uncharacterized phiE125 gp8 family phage protein
MNLIVVTPPTEELLSAAEAKLQSRVDGSTEDTLIATYIKAAREKCEEIARRAFVTQTLALVLDEWPTGSSIKLPRPPLISVTSVTYKLADGTEQEFSDFVIDTASEPGRLALADGASWPSDSLYPIGAIRIEFQAGYGAAELVPQIYKMAVQLLAAHWYENREATTPNALGSVEVPFGVSALLTGDRGWYG